ncbi:prolyl oligopeptidase family serine peptidase [Lysobacter maris]|uniref:Prolyl oligopeptidase family serine peptidase n=1 Tax=Marilutibacter maris TaxID=1605891 RepID=A0A508A7F8_9GAMM|nr:S9 family peptidase [Lysobacter maris]KAB8172438.1 prolyl oligopeptidase family serine peptidase [Lysobacter maris]
MSLATVAAAFSAPALAEAPIPVESFVKHPTYSSAKISPTGEYLAMTVDRGEQDVLTVLRTSDMSIVKVNQLPDKKSVGSFYWTSPERLLFNAVRKVGRFEQPFGTGEWFAVNADGSQPRPLIFYGTRDATQRGKTVGSETFSLLDTLKDDDVNVAMEVNYPRSSEGAGTEVVLMDTVSGRRKSLARAPKENCNITLDAAKEPNFAVCFSSKGEDGEYDERTELYSRADGGNWSLVSASKTDGTYTSIVGSTPSGTVYATQSDGKAPAAIGTLDTDTGEFHALFQDPVADISELIWSTDNEKLIAVVTEAGAPNVHMVDSSHPDARLYQSLAASFPGQMVDFSSHTEDGNKIIVSVYSDSNPGELYLYDREAGSARFLLQGRRWLDKDKMASVKPFSFTTRDNRTVYGYLTIPHGSDGKDLPMIVNPHGGPIGPRDRWGFNSEAQLFANRGYLVLQVNYRGSGGYGKAFQDAGHRQWAQGIQNDIIDATRWAIDEGHADSDRICIYGGSFGGYSSLMAPIRAQGMFKCAVGYVGVYDMPMMFDKGDIPQRESGQRFLRRTLGTDSEELRATSPTFQADKVGIPVLLVAGARDERAPPEQTEEMRDALVEAGNPPVETLIQSGEMHGFYKEENNLNLYTKMLAFFDRHIGTGQAQ